MKNTLEKLNIANTERAKQFGRIEDWTLTDWACAVNGEAGELANKCIHALRGDAVNQSEIADEAADIVIYLDLFCQRAGINLEDAIIDKFNKTSEKRKSKIIIDALPTETVNNRLVEALELVVETLPVSTLNNIVDNGKSLLNVIESALSHKR